MYHGAEGLLVISWATKLLIADSRSSRGAYGREGQGRPPYSRQDRFESYPDTLCTIENCPVSIRHSKFNFGHRPSKGAERREPCSLLTSDVLTYQGLWPAAITHGVFFRSARGKIFLQPSKLGTTRSEEGQHILNTLSTWFIRRIWEISFEY